MITEDYVSFEIAKLLKKKEFDEPCEGFYVNSDVLSHTLSNTNNSKWDKDKSTIGYISAPTLQMAMKWLREVHSILVMIDYNYECTSKSYCYKIYHLGKNGKPKRFPVYGVAYDDEGNATRDIIYYRDFQLSDSEYATYEQAVDGALYYCLEYLI